MVVAGDSMWQNKKWKRGRVVEGARLEIVWAAMSRRFESSRFRHKINDDPLWVIFFENLRGIYEVLSQ